MKHIRFKSILCAWLAAVLLTGCAAAQPQTDADAVQSGAAVQEESAASDPVKQIAFTDALGYSVTLSNWERVASLYGSFAETWTLAGGTLIGATSDAVEERGMELGADVALLGSVKQPNLEAILAADPDFLILSADTAEHVDLHEALISAGIPHAYYRVDHFSDYLEMLEQFCRMTGREDLYVQNGLAVQTEIDRILDIVQGQPAPTALLLRAFSTGAKAKGSDSMTGAMLRDLGCVNIADQNGSLLEELSMEEIIRQDPDFIFVTTMGASSEKAMQALAEGIESNPAWAGLTAVKEGRYILLSKELFHNKPNHRWGESYEILADYLYAEEAA